MIVREGGFFGLYKGLPSTLAGITPYIGIKMATFDILQTHFAVDKNDPKAKIVNLILGGTAGGVAVTFTFPTDLIRRKMQLSGQPGHAKYSGMFDAAKRIVQSEGPLGLYKGYSACMLKVVPAVSIFFMTNEMLKSYLMN